MNNFQVFSTAMFSTEPDLFETWTDIPHHPLQTQEPGGDRHWIGKSQISYNPTNIYIKSINKNNEKDSPED